MEMVMTPFVKMLVRKINDFPDNSIEENIVVLQAIEKVLGYDIDYSETLEGNDKK